MKNGHFGCDWAIVFHDYHFTLSMIYTVLYVEQYIWLMAILYPHIVQEYSISSKIEERDRSKSLHSRNSTKQYGPVYFMT